MTINLINNKKYIGRDFYNDPTYLGSGKTLKKAIKKYGKDNFKKIILEKCNTHDQLNEKEKYYIDLYDAIDSDDFYNLVEGGRGGFILNHCNEELKLKTYEKIKNSKIGKKLTKEHILNIKKGLNSYINNDEKHKYEKLDEETKKLKKVGKYNNFYNKKHDGDLKRFGKHRKNITPTNAIKVLNITTNEEFTSLVDASKNFKNPNTARRSISDVCKGKRNSFMNMKFKFIE